MYTINTLLQYMCIYTYDGTVSFNIKNINYIYNKTENVQDLW